MEKMNMMLSVAALIDPRKKFEYVDLIFRNMYGEECGEEIGNLAKKALDELFEEYMNIYSPAAPTSSQSHSTSSGSSMTSESGFDSELDSESRFLKAKRLEIQQLRSKSGSSKGLELDKYLQEHVEDYDGVSKFVLLDWWKVHSPRFPILSRLARDLLAMPISTVASESVFSTSGRIIDDFRASLTPKMAQALICGQDWLRHTPINSMEDDYEFIQEVEKDVVSSIGIESNVIDL